MDLRDCGLLCLLRAAYPPRWLSSSPFYREENWVLRKLSHLAKVTHLSGGEALPVSPDHEPGPHLAILSCLVIVYSLLPIPSHQNLFHLAGPSLNVNFLEAPFASPGAKWFLVPCTHEVHGSSSEACPVLLHIGLLLSDGNITCSWTAILNGWLSCYFFGFGEGEPAVFISEVCFGNFKFRLNLSLISEQRFLTLRDKIFLHSHGKHYEGILNEDHVFSDCDYVLAWFF